MDSVISIIKRCKTEARAKDVQFIIKHPSSFVSGYLLRDDYSYLPPDSVKILISLLNSSVQNSRPIKYIHNEFRRAKNGLVGSKAKLFHSKDINGKEVSLSQFSGKDYLLLDFWASWCSPCRRSHVHLRDIYNRYHRSGLDIIAIASDDKTKNDWRKAIESDGIGMWKTITEWKR